MRGIGAGFGLVAFLIAIAISLWMWGTYTAEVSKHGTKAQEQAQQFGGYDQQGKPAMSSFELVPEEQNGKLHYLLVDTINPQGAMAKTFGLQPKDAIVGCGPFNFREDGYDEEMAKAMILEEYKKKGQLTVLRNGKTLILPVPKDAPASAGGLGGDAQTTANNTTAGEEKAAPKELGP